MDELILSQLSYVRGLVRKYAEYHRDEVYGEVVLALVKAARAYNPERGAKFFTYARRRIHGQMQDYWRHVSRHPVVNSLDDTYCVCRRYHDPVRYVEENESRQQLEGMIEGLEIERRTVLKLYFFEGLTLKAIGDIMKCSVATVRKLRNGAIVELRRKYRWMDV